MIAMRNTAIEYIELSGLENHAMDIIERNGF